MCPTGVTLITIDSTLSSLWNYGITNCSTTSHALSSQNNEPINQQLGLFQTFVNMFPTLLMLFFSTIEKPKTCINSYDEFAIWTCNFIQDVA
jgi:hypothetical protein